MTHDILLKVEVDDDFYSIELGRTGEKNVKKVIIDCSSYFEAYGEGVGAITYAPPYSSVQNPVITTMDGTNVEWTVEKNALRESGVGSAVLRWYVDGALAKSSVIRCVIVNGGADVAPEPNDLSDWIGEATKILYEVQHSIPTALQEAKESGDFNGESAYEIAVRLGYTGTEEEWIASLKYDHSDEFAQFVARIDEIKTEAEQTASQVASDKEQVSADRQYVEGAFNDAIDAIEQQETTSKERVSDKAEEERSAISAYATTKIGEVETKSVQEQTNIANKAGTELNRVLTNIETNRAEAVRSIGNTRSAAEQSIAQTATEKTAEVDKKTNDAVLRLDRMIGEIPTYDTDIENLKDAEVRLTNQITETRDSVSDIEGRVKSLSDKSESRFEGMNTKYNFVNEKVEDLETRSQTYDTDHERRLALLENGGFDISNSFLSYEIKSWMNEHPEATTTVQDGAIDTEKLSDTLKGYVPVVVSANNLASENGNRVIYGDEENQKVILEGIKDRVLSFSKMHPYEFVSEEPISGNDDSFLVFKDCENLVIDGISIRADIYNPNIGRWSAIRLVNCHNVTIKNACIDGFKWCGIAIENTCTAIQIIGNVLTRCRFQIYDSAVGTVIANNTITDGIKPSDPWSQDSLFYDGIMAYGENTVITGNNISEVGQSGVYTDNCKNVSIIGNTIIDVHNKGIDIGNPSSVKDCGVSIVGNIVKGSLSGNINITNIKKATISNNIVTGNCVGVIFEKETSDIVLSSNTIINTHEGDASTGKNRAVSVGNEVRNVLSYGNSFHAEVPFYGRNVDRNVYNIDLTPTQPLTAVNTEGQIAITMSTVGSPIIDVGTAETLLLRKTSGARASLNCKNITAQEDGSTFASMWLTNFLRLPQTSSTTIGTIWYDATENKVKVRTSSGIKALSFE